MENESKPQGQVTIKFGKGLIGRSFTSKSGVEMLQVKVPNRERTDKTPWETFAVPAKMIHDNQYGKGVWMKLPEDSTTKVSRSVPTGKDDMGRTIWQNTSRMVSNTELKSMMEAYKEQSRDSVLGNLAEKASQSKAAPHHDTNPKRDYSR